MKIIISPSKRQNRDCIIERDLVDPLFERQSNQLREMLENMERTKLSRVLSIKGNLLDKTEEKYSDPKESKAAICCYNGLVFKQLDVNHYKTDSVNYMQKHLSILSAMYGIVTPLTAIKPYRLDMKSKLEGINFYEYWQESINEYFLTEDLIINLASNEFSKMLSIDDYEGTFINIDFKEYNKYNQLRVVAARAKKARGLILDEMIKNQISSIDELKELTVLGYIFNEEISTDEQLVFIKE